VVHRCIHHHTLGSCPFLRNCRTCALARFAASRHAHKAAGLRWWGWVFCCINRPGRLTFALATDLVQAQHADHVHPVGGGGWPVDAMAVAFCRSGSRQALAHDAPRTIARFSGFGLLAYAYIKFWDLLAVTHGRSPQINQAFAMLNDQTPYGFGFWVGEIITGF
jgi:hypothetical protein